MSRTHRCVSLLVLTFATSSCVITPENDGGLRTHDTPFVISGYAPSRPPFSIAIQQKDNTGAWVTTSTATAAVATELMPDLPLSDGVWYAWRAAVKLNTLAKYWSSGGFGGIVQSRMRVQSAGITFGAAKDALIGLDCATQHIGAGGQAVIASCASETGGEIIINTCRQPGPLYSCGPAGYPTTRHRRVIAALSGKQAVNDPQLGEYRLTGRHTDEQRNVSRNFIMREFQDMQIATEFDPFPGGANVFGWVGKTHGTSKEIVVVGGHFDSANEYTAGALDNAAGVAMVLDAAKHVKSLGVRYRRVLFVAIDLEERGKGGSVHLAERLKAWEAAGTYKVHSVHFVDEIGDTGPGLMIEAPVGYASLTDCLWSLYTETNNLRQYGIPLERYTEESSTDHMPLLQAGFRAFNLTETIGGITGWHKECLAGKSCSSECGGDCAAGRVCEDQYCRPGSGFTFNCECDIYDNLEPRYLASASLLFRSALERVVSKATTLCDH